VEEIQKMESLKGQDLNEIKKILADEVTSIAHGRSSLAEIHRAALGMFGDSDDDLSTLTSVPGYDLPQSAVPNTSIIDIMMESNICSSRGDAKRLLRSNGVYVNDETIAEDYQIPADLPVGATLKLSCGKKRRLLIRVVE
jgi:tyrosyl-tRNA synthetase